MSAPGPGEGRGPDAGGGYGYEVERLASQLCRHRQDAEDVTQNALLKAT